MSDTVFALATAYGRAAIAIIRMSGPQSGVVLQRLAGPLPPPRVASLRTLRDPVSRETLDRSIVLYLPGPTSFTGEDVVELHVHGGRAVTDAIIDALAHFGLRPADPGEFTRRAFEYGRLDLTQAEAIADLVDADTPAQRNLALSQLGGSAARAVGRWRSALIGILSTLEAAIDFPDEDIPAAVAERTYGPLRTLHGEVARAASDLRGERIRLGYRVALIGAPNAGKSALLNALVGRDAAIVTEIPGTTRDIIEQTLDVAGYRVVLADTAGMRVTDERIEGEGIRRAREWARDAELRLWVVDASDASSALDEALSSVLQGDILVLNKSDLAPGSDARVAAEASDALELEPVRASSVEDGGVIELRETLERRVVRDLGGAGAPASTRLRHRNLLKVAVEHLERALGAERSELMAEDVRLAARSLEALAGRVDTEAVLDEIFSTFCIGK